MGLAVGRFVASSVEDLAPRRELGAGIPDNTTGGGIWKIHSSTWIWASQGTRHCLLWIVLACRLCQNSAKELPGSNSSAFTSVPRSGVAHSTAPSRACGMSCCGAASGAAQVPSPGRGMLSVCAPRCWRVSDTFCPSHFPPIPSEEQAAGWGRLGTQTPHFQVVCFPQAARGRGQEPLGWVARGQLGQKVRQGDAAGMWAGYS